VADLNVPAPVPSTQSATEMSDECRTGSDRLSLSTRLLVVENAPRLNNSDLPQPVGNGTSLGTPFPLAKLICEADKHKHSDFDRFPLTAIIQVFSFVRSANRLQIGAIPTETVTFAASSSCTS
jgi:hypothetical protein